MTDKKMSLVPPKAKDDKKLRQFIEEPERKVQSADLSVSAPAQTVDDEPAVREKTAKKAQFPWEAQGVSQEIIKAFLLRLRQPDKLKAEYIVQNSLEYNSLHDFCMKAVLKQIAKEMKKFKE